MQFIITGTFRSHSRYRFRRSRVHSGGREIRCKNDYHASISLNSSLFAMESRFILFIRPNPVARLFTQSVFVTWTRDLFGRPPNSFILFPRRVSAFYFSRSGLSIFAPCYADASSFLRTET